MKEEIKIGLLAVIAGTLIVQTYLLWDGSGSELLKGNESLASTTINPQTDAKSDHDHIAAQVADNKPELPKTTIKFFEDAFDFGNIKQETENKHLFKFTNTGANPLVIENAHGSCGCTVPTWPKEPIPPGGTGEIEVVYKPGKQQGKQTKTVTVVANTDPKETRVAINADVEVPPGS
ncbi:MAG: DUF1573 domain-containing protein [Bacteroidetes bacterium]|nr:DUF1573 domain-containing protein [Bacteroidota bacterium]